MNKRLLLGSDYRIASDRFWVDDLPSRKASSWLAERVSEGGNRAD
ncbi:hypothetical protein [Sphingomonas sp. PAMC 26605]|nr:hypothetical protein [Sphingomonas sp. PAMC 26605]